MNTKRWFHYTLVVGALPLVIRCFILLFIENISISMFFNPIDFVFFGLTLNLTNINELNNLKKNDKTKDAFREDKAWCSVITIIFLAVNLGVLYLNEFLQLSVLRGITLKITSIVLCVFSLFYSLYIIKQLDKK
jgi:flagellar biosynthesis protein FlhB